MKKEVKLYKTTSVSFATEPDAVFFVKGLNDTNVRTYITTLDGQAIPLQDLTGGVGGITTLTSNDGSITITGTSTSKNIQLSSALQNLINNALQSGDAVSSLINDEGYITLADVPTFDPINYDLEDFNNSGADKFVKQSELPTKTSDLINDGSDGNSTYVEADELGDVATSNDYNDLDNKPTIPSISGLATEVDLNNHTSNTSNPHNVTKSQVGLGSVDDIQQYPNTNPSGFETPAQLNIRDTNNRARANHTGTQAISTITGLQTILNSTRQNLYLSVTPTTPLTGVTTETLATTITVPLGKMKTNSVLDIYYRSNRTGASASWTVTIKVNTVNNPSTATIISNYTVAGNFSPYVSVYIKGQYDGVNMIFNNTNQSSGNNFASSPVVPYTIACNNAITPIYFFFFITPTNSSSSITLDAIEISN